MTDPPTRKARSDTIRYVLLASAAIATASFVLIWAALGSMSPPSGGISPPSGGISPSSGGITVWQPPKHACCARWISYMRAKGYAVAVRYVDDMSTVKAKLDIPEKVQSCHTAQIDDYLIEGHVPAPAVVMLLDERPALKGIALPGMPAGPPGMGGSPGVYQVLGFTAEGRTTHFADVGI